MYVPACLQLLAVATVAVASEYPERECCDPIEPPPRVSMSGTPDFATPAAAAAAAGHHAASSTTPAVITDEHRTYTLCTFSFRTKCG